MVREHQAGNPLDQVEQVADHAQLEGLRQAADRVYLSDDVLDYLLRLVEATRQHPLILQGASPRATLSLTSVSRALALASGRDYVTPEDVQAMFRDVITHRLVFAPKAGATEQAREELLSQLMHGIKAPRLR